jgi:hypothetical protein
MVWKISIGKKQYLTLGEKMNETSILNLNLEEKKEIVIKKLKERYKDINGYIAISIEHTDPIECIALFKYTGTDWEIARGSGPTESVAMTNLLDTILMQQK